MMPHNDYIGRYGDTLRRLTALDTQGGQVSPQAVGAFEQPQPAAPAFGQQRPAQPAMGPPAPHPEDGPKVGIGDLWRDMPDEQKDQLLKQAKDSGMDIDREYSALEAEGQFQPSKKKLTIKEKLGRLAEVALKTASNMGRNQTNNSFADYADAQLATDEKYAALDRADEQQQRGEFERRRAEKLDLAKERRVRAERFAETEGARTDRAEQNRIEREARATENQAERDARAAENKAERTARADAQKTARILTDPEGNVFTLSADNVAKPILKKIKTKKKAPSGEEADVETDVPFRAAPKASSASLDQDVVLRAIETRAKQYTEDFRFKAEMRKQGITDIEGAAYKRASEEVMAQAQKLRGETGGGWKIEPAE